MTIDTKRHKYVKKKIEDYLYWDDQINESHIIVRGVEGDVRLTGTVSSEETRALLEEAVADMPGVRHVHNQLTVWKGGDEKSHTDDELRDQITKTLKLRQGIQIEDIDVEVHVEQGTVRLTGVVNTHDKKQRLEDITRNVVGVLEVENEIRVDPAHLSPSGTLL